MTDHDSEFVTLVARARAGDIEDLQSAVSKFEPHLTRAIRRRRRSQRAQTRVLYDTKDCLQSILAGFYRKVTTQQLDITSFNSLRRLLLKMIRDKLTDYERRDRAAKRPQYSDGFVEPVDDDTPSMIVSQKEELECISDGLSDTENRILELSREGHTSEEIARIIESRSSRSIRRFLKDLQVRVHNLLQGDQ